MPPYFCCAKTGSTRRRTGARGSPICSGSPPICASARMGPFSPRRRKAGGLQAEVRHKPTPEAHPLCAMRKGTPFCQRAKSRCLSGMGKGSLSFALHYPYPTQKPPSSRFARMGPFLLSAKSETPLGVGLCHPGFGSSRTFRTRLRPIPFPLSPCLLSRRASCYNIYKLWRAK